MFILIRGLYFLVYQQQVRLYFRRRKAISQTNQQADSSLQEWRRFRRVAIKMTTPIKIHRSFDVSKVKSQKNKTVIDGETTEFSIPVLSTITRGGAEQMLLMVKAFISASQFANWTPEKNFLKFEMHLQGTALTAWQTTLTTSPLRTANQFKLCIKAFKKKFLKSDDLFLLKDYLRELKKPRDIGVSEFFQRFVEFHMLIREFPDARAADQFDDQERNRILFRAMPMEWQRNFILAGNRIRDT
ncbi:MAG: hypothetical protein ACREBR_02465, partial [bacterium]